MSQPGLQRIRIPIWPARIWYRTINGKWASRPITREDIERRKAWERYTNPEAIAHKRSLFQVVTNGQ